MKRVFAIITALIVLIPHLSLAAGSVAQTLQVLGPSRDKAVLTFTWTGDSSTGSVPTTVTNDAITAELQRGWYAYLIVTKPSSPYPTDNYDIFLYDTDGWDIAGGMINNRSTTSTQQVTPKLDTVNTLYGARLITTALSIAVSNNTTASSSGIVRVFLYK